MLNENIDWFVGGRIAGRPELVDIGCMATTIVAIENHNAAGSRQGYALNGALVMPAMAQWHTHIDKTYTVERAPQTEPGLLGAINACTNDHKNWTAQDIAERANRALSEAFESGCTLVRTHVDWKLPDEPLGWEILEEVAQAWRGKVTLERVALTRAEFFDDLQLTHNVLTAIKKRGGILGAFIHSSNATSARMHSIAAQALKHELAMDLHLDEEINPLAQGLEWLLQAVAQGPVQVANRPAIAVSHICALATKTMDEAERLIAGLAGAQITVIALPTTNLFLQDQTDPACPLTPHIRGIAPVHELKRAGVTVKLSCDNVQDPFYPWGNYDPITLMQTAAPALQLMNCFNDWSDTIAAHPLAVGEAGNLVIFKGSAPSSWPAMPFANEPRLLVRGGKLVQ